MNSPRFSISGLDLKKIQTGALLGLAGVAVAVIPQFTNGVSYIINFKGHSLDLTVVVAWLASVAINFLRKYITDHTV